MGISVEPITRESLVDIVRGRLIELIQQGVLKPSDRIVESQLARGLAVSRSPVREALRQLEQQGLVTSALNRGYSVTQLDADDYAELTVVRTALEKAAARIIVDSDRIDEAAASLRRIVERMDSATARSRDLAHLTLLDWTFHEELCRQSNNRTLFAVLRTITGRMALALAAIRRESAGTTDLAATHLRLVEILESGDRRAAEEAIEEHISLGFLEYSKHGTP